MRAPSADRLVTAFRITRPTALLIRRFAKAADDGDALSRLVKRVPETNDYVRSLHRSPYGSHIWRVTVALHAINVLVGGYGVEGLGPGRAGDYAPPYEYINFGDPYVTTLVYRRKTDSLSIGSWGPIAERHPRWP